MDLSLNRAEFRFEANGINYPSSNKMVHTTRNLGLSRVPLKAKHNRAPAYSRALRRIKGVVKSVVHDMLMTFGTFVSGKLLLISMTIGLFEPTKLSVQQQQGNRF